jgi:hypothetical protein
MRNHQQPVEKNEGLGGFEPPTCGLGNPSYFTILLARLAFSYLLLAGFGRYSGVIVPKLFPSLWPELCG